MTTTTEPRPDEAPAQPVEATAEEALLRALDQGKRPARPSPVSASLTFGWRAMLKIKHVPMQLFDVTIFPIMFVLMFTFLFGGAILGSTESYLQFLLPGILVQTVVMITMYTGSALNDDAKKGVFDRFRSLPIWRPSVLVGMLLGDVMRYTIASVIVVAVGLLLGFRPEGGAVGVAMSISLLLVFSFALSWIWTALGLIMPTSESLLGVSMLLLFPLTFISNIFVPPETLPSWLRAFVELNPVSHVATAVRGLMAGEATVGQIGLVLLSSTVLVAVFGPITMYLYRNKK